MTAPIDISAPVDAELPLWPGSPGATFSSMLRIAAGDDANASRMDMDLHVGTHVDAPLHFVEGGASLEELGLDPFVGPVFVADLGDANRIGPDELERAGIPDNTRRVLLKTTNSRGRLLRESGFRSDAAAVTAAGAEWLVERGLDLIGIDYLSIQRVDDGPEPHQIILRSGMAILEGIDLSAAKPGAYDLVCLPVRLVGPEAAPARAILLPAGTL